MAYQTLRVERRRQTLVIRFDRPEADNAIDNRMVEELTDVLESVPNGVTVVVLEGTPEAFCIGADFGAIAKHEERRESETSPELLYRSWLRLSSGPFVSIAHVQGRALAGGIGFVAACDVALAQEGATFGLSELLFGLFPASVMPFLIRRIGRQRAHYLTLSTRPVDAARALEWGLVDAVDADSKKLLRTHLLRLSRVSAATLAAYKRYLNRLDECRFDEAMLPAMAANREMFSQPSTIEGIRRYQQTGHFPWEEAS